MIKLEIAKSKNSFLKTDTEMYQFFSKKKLYAIIPVNFNNTDF